MIYRYTDSVNRADWDETIKLYAHDAVWESPALEMHFDSAEAFVENLRSTTSSDLLVQATHSLDERIARTHNARWTHVFIASLSWLGSGSRRA